MQLGIIIICYCKANSVDQPCNPLIPVLNVNKSFSIRITKVGVMRWTTMNLYAVNNVQTTTFTQTNYIFCVSIIL